MTIPFKPYQKIKLYDLSDIHAGTIHCVEFDIKRKIQSKTSVGAVTGSWFRTYTLGEVASYGEKKCYPATEICCACFIIDPESGKVRVEKSI